MRLLIIEDDPRTGDMLKRGLEEEGFDITLSNEAEEGEYLALNQHYDLIILDWMLPNKSGIDILRNLRIDNINTPVLMLTAKSELDDKIISFQNGADDYLSKPFDFEELLLRIKAIYRRSIGVVNKNILIEGDMSIDLDKHTLKRDGKSFTLTPKEYELLLFFIQNKNHYLNIDTIKERLWSEQDYIDSNVIQVTIYHLRRKIGKDKIKTQRGVGYCFEGQKS